MPVAIRVTPRPDSFKGLAQPAPSHSNARAAKAVSAKKAQSHLPPLGEAIPERVITRPPSAELRPDQKDTDSLPDYSILDPILEAFIEDDLSVEEITAQGYDRDIVIRTLEMVKRNEYKRRQAPPGVRISSRAFGRDWRYPITSGYQFPH